jgi:hypothetical protein
MSSVHGRCGGVAAGTEADGAICLAASKSLSVVAQHQHQHQHVLIPRSIGRILFVIYSQKPPCAHGKDAPGPTRRVSCWRIPLTPAMAWLHTRTDPLQVSNPPDARCSTVASETRLEAVGSYEQPFDYLRLIIAIKRVRLNSYVQFFRPTAAANSNVITP